MCRPGDTRILRSRYHESGKRHGLSFAAAGVWWSYQTGQIDCSLAGCGKGSDPQEQDMIVEVRWMGFWTRVRFPPNPLPQVTVMPSRWRDSNFRKSHYNIAKLCYRLAMGFTPFHSGFCVGNHAKRLEFRDDLYCTSIHSTGFLIGPRYFIIPGISIYNVIMITGKCVTVVW